MTQVALVVCLVNGDDTRLGSYRIQDLGASQRYRVEHPHNIHLLSISWNLLDYPVANRRYRGALDVVERSGTCGPTGILLDGHVVCRPRNVGRSNIPEAVEHHVLFYIRKEETLDDVQRRYPADCYAMVDDKLRISESKEKRLGRARDDDVPVPGKIRARRGGAGLEFPPDVSVESIADLLECDLPGLLSGQRSIRSTTEVTR